jgi:transcriptional regulator NrdR family protein
MTYGYNCSLVNPNETRMMDYRQNLEDALLNARRDCKVCLVSQSSMLQLKIFSREVQCPPLKRGASVDRAFSGIKAG